MRIAVIVLTAALGWAAAAAPRSATRSSTRSARERTLDLGGKVTMTFVLIPAGEFVMGSPEHEGGRDRDEGPRRRVTISRPFYMGVYEVTQEQYEAVMGENPSHFKGARNPVEMVSWDDAVAFCRKLSARTDRTIRLPTEAEWEYACRAGTRTRFSFGNSEAELHRYGNYCDRSNTGGFGHQDKAHDDGYDKTAPVGSFRPNAFGLHDMHGNLQELCWDLYQKDYRGLETVDPKGPKTGSYGVKYVKRGGGWPDPPRFCRSADRNWKGFASGFIDCGFRVVVAFEE
jgi:formylglycine-generating enzyme required for sulfatase activity